MGPLLERSIPLGSFCGTWFSSDAFSLGFHTPNRGGSIWVGSVPLNGKPRPKRKRWVRAKRLGSTGKRQTHTLSVGNSQPEIGRPTPKQQWSKHSGGQWFLQGWRGDVFFLGMIRKEVHFVESLRYLYWYGKDPTSRVEVPCHALNPNR